MTRYAAVLLVFASGSAGFGQDLPGCAMTGSKSVLIGGKPALRLSDVVKCPPDSYEILSSIMIDGQPMVRFKPVHFGKTRCAVMGDATVIAENNAATPGEVHCSVN